jgi:hypothetical protein
VVGQFALHFSVETDELLGVHSKFWGKRPSIEKKRSSRIPRISSHPTNIRPVSTSRFPNRSYIDIIIKSLFSLLISTWSCFANLARTSKAPAFWWGLLLLMKPQRFHLRVAQLEDQLSRLKRSRDWYKYRYQCIFQHFEKHETPMPWDLRDRRRPPIHFRLTTSQNRSRNWSNLFADAFSMDWLPILDVLH